MSTVEVLRSAKALIADPARWTTGAYARDSGGNGVNSRDPSAVCWCALGALRVQPCAIILRAHYELLAESSRLLFGEHVGNVNDQLGHAAVMRVYGRAIELAEAQQ